jgi:hypothetical protein
MKASIIRGIVGLAVCGALVIAGCTKSPTAPDNQYGNTTNGYFTITQPAYGDSVLLGSTISLGWVVADTSMINTSVVISLYQGDNLVHTYYAAYLNPGSDTISLTIGAAYAGTGSDYHFRIASTADPTKYDVSYYFRVYSPYTGSYTVTSPTADSSLSMSATHIIQWTTAGTLGAATTVSLYYDTSLVQTLTTAAVTANGNYSWIMAANFENSNRYRIRVSNTADMGLYAYSPFFTIQGVDPDSYESDGAPASAKSITTDGVAQSRTLTFHDTDWVSFTAVSGTTYTIQTFGNLDTYLYLYQSDGVTLIASDDDSGAGTNAMIIWACTTSGTYYFKVRGFSARWMGAYTVSVQ